MEKLITSFACVLDLHRKDVDVEISFIQVGLDSIAGIEWVRDLNQIFSIELTLAQIHENSTIRDLALWIAEHLSSTTDSSAIDSLEPIRLPEYTSVSPIPLGSELPPKNTVLKRWNLENRLFPSAWPQYPELIKLHQGSLKGRPIFWIHGGNGSVHSYTSIARHVDRPMYGIQPRGWMTSREPLQGIQAMAAYYIQIIQSVQPQGPYELGGFSLGGRIAYEITRQLQELGQSVQSIVFIDSYLQTPYQKEQEDLEEYKKIISLQAVNSILMAYPSQDGHSVTDKLIHAEQMYTNSKNVDSLVFLEQLLLIAEERGMNSIHPDWKTRVLQSIRIQVAYQLSQYPILPLLYPDEVSAYYFRCEGESFYGDLLPYFTWGERKESSRYWEEWKALLPHFEVMDVPANSHYGLLSSSAAMQRITEFCAELYNSNSKYEQTILKIGENI
nr:thioesterase domain-containing protein [Paenibacillus shirakamiensis]